MLLVALTVAVGDTLATATAAGDETLGAVAPSEGVNVAVRLCAPGASVAEKDAHHWRSMEWYCPGLASRHHNSSQDNSATRIRRRHRRNPWPPTPQAMDTARVRQ